MADLCVLVQYFHTPSIRSEDPCQLPTSVAPNDIHADFSVAPNTIWPGWVGTVCVAPNTVERRGSRCWSPTPPFSSHQNSSPYVMTIRDPMWPYVTILGAQWVAPYKKRASACHAAYSTYPMGYVEYPSCKDRASESAPTYAHTHAHPLGAQLPGINVLDRDIPVM
jgi:hypothetical protein